MKFEEWLAAKARWHGSEDKRPRDGRIHRVNSFRTSTGSRQKVSPVKGTSFQLRRKSLLLS